MSIENLKREMKKNPKILRTCRHNKHPVIMNPSFSNLDSFNEYKILGNTMSRSLEASRFLHVTRPGSNSGCYNNIIRLHGTQCRHSRSCRNYRLCPLSSPVSHPDTVLIACKHRERYRNGLVPVQRSSRNLLEPRHRPSGRLAGSKKGGLSLTEKK